jgi:hypothetical protein
MNAATPLDVQQIEFAMGKVRPSAPSVLLQALLHFFVFATAFMVYALARNA